MASFRHPRDLNREIELDLETALRKWRGGADAVGGGGEAAFGKAIRVAGELWRALGCR